MIFGQLVDKYDYNPSALCFVKFSRESNGDLSDDTLATYGVDNSGMVIRRISY